MQPTLLNALLLLGTIFVVLPLGLFFGLRWLARRWLKGHPSNAYAAKITRTGWIVYLGVVLLLFSLFAAGQLAYTSPLGRFMREPGGMALAAAACAVLSGIVERILTKSGYPLRVAAPPASVVFPPGTELRTLPDFVPRGFRYGVEILNDDKTPMEFVVKILQNHFGLNRRHAFLTMLSIHSRGGALVPLASLSLAENAAQAVSAEAAAQSFPLICRAVAAPLAPPGE